MKIIENPGEMQKLADELRKEGKTIGLVPTMGALHEGHISLVRAARKENAFVAASIFVNPIQFGPKEDLSKYPRTFDEDCRLLENAGCDALFFPAALDMYPEGFETYVELKNLTNHLCGLKREGHFRGVTTVVTKLFNIVKPHTAYFGQKDYQQALVIRRMARDLNMDTVISMQPIVRESDGLAMSSRNRYLTPEERAKALILYKALTLGEKLVREGETDAQSVLWKLENLIMETVPEAKIDYINIVHPDTLEDLKLIEIPCVIALAVYIGNTRLIDNCIIG